MITLTEQQVATIQAGLPNMWPVPDRTGVQLALSSGHLARSPVAEVFHPGTGEYFMLVPREVLQNGRSVGPFLMQIGPPLIELSEEQILTYQSDVDGLATDLATSEVFVLVPSARYDEWVRW